MGHYLSALCEFLHAVSFVPGLLHPIDFFLHTFVAETHRCGSVVADVVADTRRFARSDLWLESAVVLISFKFVLFLSFILSYLLIFRFIE